MEKFRSSFIKCSFYIFINWKPSQAFHISFKFIYYAAISNIAIEKTKEKTIVTYLSIQSSRSIKLIIRLRLIFNVYTIYFWMSASQNLGYIALVSMMACPCLFTFYSRSVLNKNKNISVSSIFWNIMLSGWSLRTIHNTNMALQKYRNSQWTQPVWSCIAVDIQMADHCVGWWSVLYAASTLLVDSIPILVIFEAWSEPAEGYIEHLLREQHSLPFLGKRNATIQSLTFGFHSNNVLAANGMCLPLEHYVTSLPGYMNMMASES